MVTDYRSKSLVTEASTTECGWRRSVFIKLCSITTHPHIHTASPDTSTRFATDHSGFIFHCVTEQGCLQGGKWTQLASKLAQGRSAPLISRYLLHPDTFPALWMLHNKFTVEAPFRTLLSELTALLRSPHPRSRPSGSHFSPFGLSRGTSGLAALWVGMIPACWGDRRPCYRKD